MLASAYSSFFLIRVFILFLFFSELDISRRRLFVLHVCLHFLFHRRVSYFPVVIFPRTFFFFLPLTAYTHTQTRASFVSSRVDAHSPADEAISARNGSRAAAGTATTAHGA